METTGSSTKLTINDILGSWINNMDDAERALYENIKSACAAVGLTWNKHNDIEFANVDDVDFRKEIMKDYLKRLNNRPTSPEQRWKN